MTHFFNKKYPSNWDKVFEKRTWKYWAKYEGLDYENIVFDKYMLEEDEKMTYNEFKQRQKYISMK